MPYLPSSTPMPAAAAGGATMPLHLRTHYSVLNLPSPVSSTPSAPLSAKDIKRAYHRALLIWHPDKSKAASAAAAAPPPSSSVEAPQEARAAAAAATTTTRADTKDSAAAHDVPTIDAITTAYKVLSDPAARQEYDRELLLRRRRKEVGALGGAAGDAEGEQDDGVIFGTFDLDELEYEDAEGGSGGTWYKGCRCGLDRAYVVTEQELEREVESGEVVVGCRGCSLWAVVGFGVVDDDDEEEGG